MTEWQKVAFLEEELLPTLWQDLEEMTDHVKPGFLSCIREIENYQQYLINKESDEQERQEIMD